MSPAVKYQIKSFAITFLSDFSVEAGVFLIQLYNGDFSMAVLSALGTAAVRTLIKVILKMIFPTLFNGQNDDTSN